MQPLHLQHLFAPIDAEVRELHVSAGQAVERDTPLITLESRELALSREKLQGEKLAAEERLRGLESSRLVDRPRAATDLPDQLSVSASEREYREQLASLAAQLAIIEAQAAGLIIRSPTQGTVLTWDLEQRLRSRPVQIGQRLLSVADLNGPWELRLHVPEATSGFVLEAWKTPATELPIEFHLMARPSEHWAAVLTELSIESTLSEAGESGLECRAHIDRPLDPQPRPGQIVRARINCGRRPRAVVWFHDLIRVWHTYVW